MKACWSMFYFFFFLSNLLLKIISVLLPLTNHLKWMSCFLSIKQKKCEEKIFQLHAMSTCIDEGFLSAKSGISCLALKIFNLSNPEMTILDAKNQLKVARYKELSTVFFSGWIQSHGLVILLHFFFSWPADRTLPHLTLA